MAGASETYHEPLDKLSPRTRDMHRALVSLQEELEAIDWYQQRADGTEDEELKAVLLHNMREEVEHASMILEWLRRNNPEFQKNLRVYLFQEGRITEIEETEEGPRSDSIPPQRQPSLRKGMMRPGRVSETRLPDRVDGMRQQSRHLEFTVGRMKGA